MILIGETHLANVYILDMQNYQRVEVSHEQKTLKDRHINIFLQDVFGSNLKEE